MSGFTSPSRHSIQSPRLAPRVVSQPNSQVNRRVPFLIAVILTPFTLFYSSLTGLFRLLFQIFRLVTGVARASPRTLSTQDITRIPDDPNPHPREEAVRFIQQLEPFCGRYGLPFFEGSYAQAYDVAKSDLKYLVIIILSSEHDENGAFVRHTLTAPETIAFIRERSADLVLWGGSVLDSETYRVASALGCSKLPYTAIVAHNDYRGSAPSMYVLARMSGSPSQAGFVSFLGKTMDQHTPNLNTARSSRNARQTTTNLRDEQNSAYERSLAADREKSRRRREAEEAEKREEERRLHEEHEALLQQRMVKRWRQMRSRLIAPEPGPGVEDVCRISIRMLDGKRVIRRFRSDLPVEELYAYVECYDELQGVQANGHPGESSQLQEHEYRFLLVSPMPRGVCEYTNAQSIGLSIGKSGNLIVEPVDEDEE